MKINCFYIHELHIMNIKLRLFVDKQLNIKLSKSLIQTNDSISLQLHSANLHKTVSSWLRSLVFFCQQSTMSLFTLKARAWCSPGAAVPSLRLILGSIRWWGFQFNCWENSWWWSLSVAMQPDLSIIKSGNPAKKGSGSNGNLFL